MAEVWGSMDALWQPLSLGNTMVPNRIMTSAMTLQYGIDGMITERHRAFYEERAKGGVGLIFSEQISASPLSVSPFSSALIGHSDRQVGHYGEIANSIEPYGTKFMVQLFAAGAAGSSMADLDSWTPVRGPSRVGSPGGEVPSALTATEIQQLVSDFAQSAKRVQDGELHGIEIHGAHGWLIRQFLSPLTNHRKDRYGGSIKNRCSLAIEIAEAIRGTVGVEFPLGISLTYDELIGDSGITPGETLTQLGLLSDAKLFNFFDISIGSSHSRHFTISPMNVRNGYSYAFGKAAREVVRGRASVFMAGRITDLTLAAKFISDGAADMVAMSRSHLADPFMIREAKEHSPTKTRCIGANICVGRALQGKPVTCVLNPRAGRERTWKSTPSLSNRPRRVLVVGGGPAGLRYAATAAEAGHNVSLFESAPKFGGHLRILASLPTRGAWMTAIDDLERAVATNGGALHVGRKVDDELVQAEDPDVAVIATGSVWAIPEHFSSTGPASHERAIKVIPIDEAIVSEVEMPGALGHRVVLVDGSGMYEPLGLAELLGTHGAKVYVVSDHAWTGTLADRTLDVPHVMPRLRELDVEIITQSQVGEINDQSITIQPIWGSSKSQLDNVDAIVVSLARTSIDALSSYFETRALTTIVIGDARSPRETTAVIHEAERFARSI